MTELTVVVGAQFGSEGKGAVTGHLTRNFTEDDVTVRVAGPNAGHTVWDDQGREWKLRCVPVAAVTAPRSCLYLAAGSEVDPQVLFAELTALDEAGFNATQRLQIHPSATVLEFDKHSRYEHQLGLVGRVGSTGKGIGAARAERILRNASTWGDFAKDLDYGHLTGKFGPVQAWNRVVVEGTQGYGLGLHTDFYPQVTSSDCRAVDFLSLAGLSPWAKGVHLTVQLVARVYPIRVAGNSGPLQGETSWADLGLAPEFTTVTHKERRVGAWDQQLVAEAVKENGGGDWHPDVKLALTMVDQKFPEVKDVRDPGHLDGPAHAYVVQVERSLQTWVNLVGTGPTSVVEL